jgi:hypothetical protein
MPTGYTAAVQDGTITEFKDFAFQCARAFGALVMMRDELLDAPIPEAFQPSDWNAKELEKATAKFVELQAMTPEACDAAALADYNAQCESRATSVLKRTVQRERYESMLEQAKGWTPPTPDHEEMKAFMVQQLEESIKFDCRDFTESLLVQQTGAGWRASQLINVQRNIDYHTKANAEELERTASRNAWVKALRDSLAPVAA